MTFAFSIAELHLPEARNLKQKRQVVRSLVDKIHRRCRVSVAETEHHDLHQRAEIAIAAVHRDGREMERLLDSIVRIFDAEPRATLLSWRPELFGPEP